MTRPGRRERKGPGSPGLANLALGVDHEWWGVLKQPDRVVLRTGVPGFADLHKLVTHIYDQGKNSTHKHCNNKAYRSTIKT